MDGIDEIDFLYEELEKDGDALLLQVPELHQLPTTSQDEDIHRSLPEEISFISEVHSIMHACGDVKKPLANSVKLMYNILQEQMALLIKKAEGMIRKAGKKISHEELLFLMRKNKMLLKRLLQFLVVEDAKTSINRISDAYSREKGERVSQCLKFLSFIEKFTGDLTFILRDESIVDYVHMKRLKRRDLMTESMTMEDYQSFSEHTLKVSFCHKNNTGIFKTWLQQCSSTKTDITPLALSIIHFLARETIAVIVDKALEIKSRMHKKEEFFTIENFSNPVDLCCKQKQDVNQSVNKLQLPLSGLSEDNSYNIEDSTCTPVENKTEESNIINSVQNCTQETNSFSSTSDSTRDIVKYPAGRDAQEKSMTVENSIDDNASKKIKKEFFFSVNFQPKLLSVCYDGSKIFETCTSLPAEADKVNKTTDIEDKDLTASCFMEYIEEPVLNSSETEKSTSRSLSDFGNDIANIFTTPLKMDNKVYWFPEEAITPQEIEAAYIFFQQPLPMSYLMKTELPVPPRTVHLVCLADPDK